MTSEWMEMLYIGYQLFKKKIWRTTEKEEANAKLNSTAILNSSYKRASGKPSMCNKDIQMKGRKECCSAVRHCDYCKQFKRRRKAKRQITEHNDIGTEQSHQKFQTTP